MKLAQTSFLRALVAKHRTVVKVPSHAARSVKFSLDKGTHDAGRPLRAQTNVVTAFVLKLIHLLTHDVATLPDAAAKKCRLLQVRSQHELVSVVFRDLFADLDYPLIKSRLGRQNILHPP